MANENKLKDVRCPECLEDKRFIVQITMNVPVEDDGFDFSYGRMRGDQFPGRVVPENDGFLDEDPITCASYDGCGYTGTVGEFKAHSRELAHV